MSEDFAAAWAEAAKAAEAAEASKGEAKEAPEPEAKVETEAAAEDEKPESEGEEKPTEKAEAKPEKDEKAEEADTVDERDEGEVREDRDREQLAKLAKRLGLKIEGDTVAADERVKFREEKRETRKRLQAERDAWEGERAKFLEQDAKNGEKYKGLQTAIEAGDLDKIAELLDAKSWNELNQQLLVARSSPQAKEMAALKKQLREREEREAKQAEDAKREARTRAEEHERKVYFSELRDTIEASPDPIVRELGKVSGFLDVVLQQQIEEHKFDKTLGKYVTITHEEAIKRAVSEAKKQLENLNAAFGKKSAADDDADEAEPKGKANGKPVKKPSGKSSGGKTINLADIDTTTPEGDKRWHQEMERLFKQANG